MYLNYQISTILENQSKHGIIDIIKCIRISKRRHIISNEDRNPAKGKDKPLINEKIRSKEVRLIDENGNNHGVVPTSKALEMAEEAELDLVVISPNQAPPVAKILNFGKYKYELEKKAKEAKKKQHVVAAGTICLPPR